MPDIYEQLQTEADVEAEKIRPTKEESSLYGAKWLTVEELLTDDTGYQQFAVDSAKGGGGGGSSIPMMTLTVIAPAGTTEEETYSWVCFDNNNMLQAPILTEGENIIKMLYMQMGDEVFPATYRNIGTHTFSNLINCILDEDALLITDPTIDSSATLTITSWEDIG